MLRYSVQRAVYHMITVFCLYILVKVILYAIPLKTVDIYELSRSNYRSEGLQQNGKHIMLNLLLPEEEARAVESSTENIHYILEKGKNKEEEKLKVIERFLARFMQELNTIRSTVLRSIHNGTWPTLQAHKIGKIFAHDRNFFHQLSKLFYIKTLFISTQKDILNSLVINQYYDYSSNNCTMVETNSKGSSAMIKNLYNATCTLSQSHILSPVDLSQRLVSFNTFLPYGYQTQPGEYILSYILIIPYAVVDTNGDVITSDVTIVPRRCRDTYVFDSLEGTKLSDIPEYDEVFAVYQFFGKEFYHSSMENLHRISPYLQFLQSHPSIKIHVGYHHPFLSLLKLDKARLVTGRVRAKVLYMPAGGLCGVSPVFASQLLSLYLRKTTPPVGVRDTVILIQRSKQKKRHFKHHDLIMQMLKNESKSWRLRVEVFSDSPLPSLSRTAEMFSRALIVVSPHGAGAVNMLFSSPGTALLEGLHPGPAGFPNLCFVSLAQALGFRYHGVFSEKGVTEYTAEDIRQPFQDLLKCVI